MKKFIALCLSVMFFLCAIAETNVALTNPVTEYDSLAEINAIVGSNLARPPVMGVTDERFSVIETDAYAIAQYDFCVNGLEYTLRCAPVAYEDISGVSIDAEPAFGSAYSGEPEYVFAEGVKLSRWLDINGQYVLCLKDRDGVLDEETFRLITEEFMNITSVVMSEAALAEYYQSLEGDYEDAFSQRAHMSVTALGSEGARFEVYWADSAFALYSWKMTVKLYEDGLLCYSDCVCAYEEYGDNGETKAEVLYENGEGFFSFSEGTLYWNGAENENCRDCEFVKPE